MGTQLCHAGRFGQQLVDPSRKVICTVEINSTVARHPAVEPVVMRHHRIACTQRFHQRRVGAAHLMPVGAADEWHQLSLPGRGPGWDDLVADAVGAALGATALRWRTWVKRWVEVRMGADC